MNSTDDVIGRANRDLPNLRRVRGTVCLYKGRENLAMQINSHYCHFCKPIKYHISALDPDLLLSQVPQFWVLDSGKIFTFHKDKTKKKQLLLIFLFQLLV